MDNFKIVPLFYDPKVLLVDLDLVSTTAVYTVVGILTSPGPDADFYVDSEFRIFAEFRDIMHCAHIFSARMISDAQILTGPRQSFVR